MACILKRQGTQCLSKKINTNQFKNNLFIRLKELFILVVYDCILGKFYSNLAERLKFASRNSLLYISTYYMQNLIHSCLFLQ